MAEDNKIKISELTQTATFSGSERVPMAVSGGNRSATMAVLKEYFKDSTLVLFNEIDDDPDPSPSEEAYTDGVVFGVVYLPSVKAFAEKRKISGRNYYTYAMARSEDYQTTKKVDGVNVREVRQDKVFFNFDNKELYTFNGSLQSIFDSIRINVMTEEELERLENPIEGAIYATLE